MCPFGLWLNFSTIFCFIGLPVFCAWFGYGKGGVAGAIFGVALGAIVGLFSWEVLPGLPLLLSAYLSVLWDVFKDMLRLDFWATVLKRIWKNLTKNLWLYLLITALLMGVEYFWGIEIQWDEIFKTIKDHE